jgi:hypothetical protein
MKIWKYSLALTESQTLWLPEGSKLLTIQKQFDYPQLWALVDEKKRHVARNFRTHTTGVLLPDGDLGEYIGSYQIFGGCKMLHVFELA